MPAPRASHRWEMTFLAWAPLAALLVALLLALPGAWPVVVLNRLRATCFSLAKHRRVACELPAISEAKRE
ncbi:hypothetical protein PSP6_580010 [Paraburkholderia tropica]|nr:hypothetical protein PSP6_580010 [Paraburkholderia tropica]